MFDDFEGVNIAISAGTDNWGPLTFNMEPLLPDGELLSEVDIKVFCGNTETTDELIDMLTLDATSVSVSVRFQYPGDAFTGLHEIHFSLTTDHGGTHEPVYRYVSVYNDASVHIDEFVKAVRRNVKAPVPVIQEIVREIIQEFCEKTYIINAVINVFGSPLDSKIEVNLSHLGINLIPHRIYDLSVNKTPAELVWQSFFGNVPEHYETQRTKYYTLSELSAVFMPFSMDSQLTFHVALKPDPNAMEFPYSLFQNWKDEIVSGVIASMCMQKDKSYTDPQFAMMHRGLYNGGITRAKGKWLKSNIHRKTGKRFV